MVNLKPIRKAVFPVAGLGTRFLPATKAIPKEMLPIVDKPLIQYAVEEAIEAGIETLIFVTSHKKRALQDHFEPDEELQAHLQESKKDHLHKRITEITPPHVSIEYVIQEEALGLGHAVWCAKSLVGDEPFAVLLADDLIRSSGRGCLAQMVDEYMATGASVIGVEDVPAAMTDRYGIVSVVPAADGRKRINAIVEKPAPEVAPSTLGVVGRYILPGDIFKVLETVRAGVGGEIQLTDAIAALLVSHPVHAYAFQGVRYDCGSHRGFVRATVDFALQRKELRDDLLAHLDTIPR